MAVTDLKDSDVAYWTQEIKQAKKREEKFRKTGKDILKIYHAEDEKLVPFNILFSNTETLLPAIYSAQARPVVQRRFQDADPIGKLASEAGRRALSYFLDTNRQEYEPPHEAFESIVLDALTPGRGMLALKYDADFRPIAETESPKEDATEPTDAEEMEYAEEAYNESVCVESLVWDRVLIGYAKKWSKVPWVAYEYSLTQEEVASLLGAGSKDKKESNKAKRLAAKLRYANEKGDDDEKDDEKDTQGQRKFATVYQIWDRAGGKKVKYFSPTYSSGLLKEDDDPLGLTGFFNTPRPLTFIRKSSSLIPTAPYQYYKVQAEELNETTRRINRIMKACRARALYDAQFGEDLERLMQKDDATMVPISASSSLAAEKGVQNAVWFYPVETIVATVRELTEHRERVKQVIYEITGISDILRGATQASETATAQKIKNSWGTLRLKRIQSDVARYVRDVLRMALELMATKYSEETWASMTGLPFTLQPQMQQLQMQAQAIAQQGQQVPPELQAQLAAPTWQQILEVLRNDVVRSYRIDIETNSTVEPEAADDQDAIMKMLGAMGQAMNGIAPLVANGSMPFDVAKNIMLVVARRFRYGDQFEDAINAMQPPQPQGQDQGAKEAEAAQKELEIQKKNASAEIQHQQKKASMDLEEQQMRQEMDAMKREVELMKREMKLQLNQDRHRMKQQFDQQSLGQGVQAMQAIVQQLAQMVAKQSQDNHRMIQEMVASINRPRTKKAIRGKDGRIESVEEMVA